MITEKDLIRANLFLKKFLPTCEPFELKEENGSQELISKSLEFQIYYGDIFQGDKSKGRVEKIKGFLLQVNICTPGVRYRKDGSGEPDTWDLQDLSTHNHLEEALNELVKSELNNRLSYFWQDLAEEEFMKSREEEEESVPFDNMATGRACDKHD
jgi:hypothetical protein